MDNDAVFRDSWRSPKLWIIDAKVWFIIPLLLLHPRLWTLGLMIAFLIVLAVSEMMFRFDLVSSMRAVRSNLYGEKRPARPINRRLVVLDRAGVPQLNLFENSGKK